MQLASNLHRPAPIPDRNDVLLHRGYHASDWQERPGPRTRACALGVPAASLRSPQGTGPLGLSSQDRGARQAAYVPGRHPLALGTIFSRSSPRRARRESPPDPPEPARAPSRSPPRGRPTTSRQGVRDQAEEQGEREVGAGERLLRLGSKRGTPDLPRRAELDPGDQRHDHEGGGCQDDADEALLRRLVGPKRPPGPPRNSHAFAESWEKGIAGSEPETAGSGPMAGRWRRGRRPARTTREV
jgi:hypothetical protein